MTATSSCHYRVLSSVLQLVRLCMRGGCAFYNDFSSPRFFLFACLLLFSSYYGGEFSLILSSLLFLLHCCSSLLTSRLSYSLCGNFTIFTIALTWIFFPSQGFLFAFFLFCIIRAGSCLERFFPATSAYFLFLILLFVLLIYLGNQLLTILEFRCQQFTKNWLCNAL